MICDEKNRSAVELESKSYELGECKDFQLNLPPQNPETSTERNTGLPTRPGAPFGLEGQEPEQEVYQEREGIPAQQQKQEEMEESE